MKHKNSRAKETGSFRTEFGLFALFMGPLMLIGVVADFKQRTAFKEAFEISSQRWESARAQSGSRGEEDFVSHLQKECQIFRKNVYDAGEYLEGEAECVSRKTLEILAHSYANQADPESIQNMRTVISREFSARD